MSQKLIVTGKRRKLPAQQMSMPVVETEDESDALESSKTLSYTASLISQGKHRFHTLTVPSDVLAETCTVDSRIENPMDGFQRKLDKKRAEVTLEELTAEMAGGQELAELTHELKRQETA